MDGVGRVVEISWKMTKGEREREDISLWLQQRENRPERFCIIENNNDNKC